jgi:hypothetical protein
MRMFPKLLRNLGDALGSGLVSLYKEFSRGG